MPASPVSFCTWSRTKTAALHLLLCLAGLMTSASVLARSDSRPDATHEFTQPAPQIQSVLPEVDKIFDDFFQTQHIPGLVYGVILDGKLIHARALGFGNLERKTPASRNTAFRIASMTKSFIAMAIFKLRDDGRLALDDPVAKYLPEFRRAKLPTADSTPVTIRQLMTMTAGLPEDNPWGDRQLAITKTELTKFVEAGLSFSTPPGQQFEYSNLGFVLLGQIVPEFPAFLSKNTSRNEFSARLGCSTRAGSLPKCLQTSWRSVTAGNMSSGASNQCRMMARALPVAVC